MRLATNINKLVSCVGKTLLIALITTGAIFSELAGIERDTIVYRGNLTVDGQPFNGTAYFKFALLDLEGKPLWGNSPTDSQGIPLQAIELAVTEGAYTVTLGSTDNEMVELPEIVVDAYPHLSLRIWFDEGEKGFQKLEPEQNLAEAPKQMIVSDRRKLLANAEANQVENLKTSTSKGGGARDGKKFQFSEPLRYSVGNPQAKVVLIEYADYECSHCRLFHEVTFPKIKEEYIDKGLLYFMSGNYPLRNNRHSQKAAEASYCAGEQGQYWAMRDLLFENNHTLGSSTFLSLAGQLGLDLQRFQACLDNNLYTTEIQNEKLRAKSFGIRQTPSFILGRPYEDNAVVGDLVTGTRYWTEFKKQINKLLSQP